MKEKMEIVEKINYRDILSISFSVSLSNNIFYLNTEYIFYLHVSDE